MTIPNTITIGALPAAGSALGTDIIMMQRGTTPGAYMRLTLDQVKTFIGSTGGGTWGSITGTLSNQTDLQAALDVASESSAIGGAVAGGTSGSALYVDVDGNLAQDTGNYFYNHIDSTLNTSGGFVANGPYGTIVFGKSDYYEGFVGLFDYFGGYLVMGIDLLNSRYTFANSRIVVDDVTGYTMFGDTSEASRALVQLVVAGLRTRSKFENGYFLSNPERAVAGEPQFSPPVTWGGTTHCNGVDTFKEIQFSSITAPADTSPGTTPEGKWTLRVSLDEGKTNTDVMAVTQSGRIEATSAALGTTSPNAAAKLDVVSTTQGILFPRMTTTQKNAIASPPAGLVVYDTTLNKLCVRGASAWQTITSV